MKRIKIVPLLLSSLLFFSCNDNSSETQNSVMDTTSTDPTTNASDYHPDQRQHIPVTDSSNTIGTDTINASESTPNTGTNKTYNDAKGNRDSSKQ
jgi:hypothetical protein